MGSVVQVHPDPPIEGGVAQLGEHLLCKQGVIGSIPFTSTNNFALSYMQGEVGTYLKNNSNSSLKDCLFFKKMEK